MRPMHPIKVNPSDLWCRYQKLGPNREAFEEAGLVGRVAGKRSIGTYHYSKRLNEHRELLCRVKVFLLAVEHQVDEWPEREQRGWCWIEPIKAAQMVEEGGLAEFIRGAFPYIRRLEPQRLKRRRLPR